MSLMNTEEKIRHYQRSIDRSHYDKTRLMHCISVLSKLPVTVHHLQITGIGRTVNSLRKFDEGVGEAAKRLVGKWKVMVANTDTSEEEDEACVPDVPESYESPDCDSDTEKSNQNNPNDCDEAIRKLADSPPGMVIETNDADDSSYHNNDNDADSNEEEKEENAIADVSENKHKHKSGHSSKQHSSDKHESSKEKNKNREKSSSSSSSSNSKSKHSDNKKRKHESSDSFTHAEENSKKRRNDSTEEEAEQDSDDQFVMNDAEEDQEKSSSEEEVHKKDKVSSRKSDKHNNESKVKSKHHSSSSHKTKTHESSDKLKKDGKSTSKSDDTGKEDKRKSEEYRSKESSRSKSSSSSKDESKSKDKDKDKHSKESSSSAKISNKVVKDDKGKSKDGEDQEKVKEDRDSKQYKEKKKHKKDKESKEGKERKKEKKATIDGIDSNSGTSFADALGMCPMPPPSKKKKETSSSSLPKSNKSEKTSSASSSTSSLGSPTPSCSKSSSSTEKIMTPDSPEPLPLLSPNIKLAPLSRIDEEVDLAATLPEPSLNYKPLPQLSHIQRKLDEDEMLTQVIHAKNLRTKVYSGNKTGYTNVPTLYDMCIRVLIENIDALEYTGGVPYYIIKPVLERATPDQLFMLEHHNPYLIEESDSLWQFHCNKDFRTKKREEMESWREMYMRCLDEREAKLKSLTANIRQQQIEKAAPVRQTKLAYVDNIVKPPRNVMRKQAKYGTANHTTPSDAKKKLIAAASGAPSSSSSGGAPVERISVPPPPVHRGRPPSSNPVKKVKAPLMAKALQAIKGRYKR